MTSNKQIIENFYCDEDHIKNMADMTMKLSVKAQVSDATMLNAIARRFETTRSDLVSEILHNAVLEMYFALGSSDRRLLSEQADTESTEQLAKQGIKVETHYSGGTVEEDATWRTYADACEKAEREKEAK